MKQIYKFSAAWCQPCKTLTARLKQKDITLPEYDIDNPDNKVLMERYNIRSVPTIVVDDDGLVQHFVGAVTTAELLEAIK
jgi:glutaredoxin